MTNDYPPQYVSDASWGELLDLLNAAPELRERMGVKLSWRTGMAEEYTLVDRLGGELNIWPAKWRAIIESGQAAFNS